MINISILYLRYVGSDSGNAYGFGDYKDSPELVTKLFTEDKLKEAPTHTLIDNIFSNVIDPDIISGNLTATISDHLPQFAIIPNMFGNIPGNKSNMKRTGPNLIKRILF